MRKFCLLLLGIIVLVSCDSNTSYNEFKNDFENNRWLTKEVQEFNFEIKESDLFYAVKMQFGHIYQYNFKTVPFKVEIAYPGGEIELLRVVMDIRDEKGNDLGECTGDVCDVFKTIKEKIQLQPGKYKISIQPEVDTPYLPNVLGIGVVVEKEEVKQ